MIRLALALALTSSCAATVPCGYWKPMGWARLADGTEARVCQGAHAALTGWQTCRAFYVEDDGAWLQVGEDCQDAPTKTKRR